MSFKLFTSLFSIFFALIIVSIVVFYSESELSVAPAEDRMEVVIPAESVNANGSQSDHGCPYLREAMEKGCPAFAPKKVNTGADAQQDSHML